MPVEETSKQRFPLPEVLGSDSASQDGIQIQLDLDEGSDKQKLHRSRVARGGRLLWWLLGAMTLVLGAATVAPTAVLGVLGLEPAVQIDSTRRILLGLATLGTALITAGLHRHFAAAMKVTKLPGGAYLLVGAKGICIHHPGLLTQDIRMGWGFIKAVTIDGGLSPDGRENQKRFPLARNERTRYLYDPDDVNSVPIVMLSTTPRTPNLVIVFNRPVTFRTEHAKALEATFGKRGHAVPVVPPGTESLAIAVMVSVANVRDARSAFLPSGRLRALSTADFKRPADN